MGGEDVYSHARLESIINLGESYVDPAALLPDIPDAQRVADELMFQMQTFAEPGTAWRIEPSATRRVPARPRPHRQRI